MNLNRTNHAQVRHQNRATIPLIESLLWDCGTWQRANSSAWIVFFDKAALKRLRRILGGDRSLRLIEGHTNNYLIVGDDGQIITTGHRTKHITRH